MRLQLEDAEFGLSGAQAVNALGLKREVKMWQCTHACAFRQC